MGNNIKLHRGTYLYLKDFSPFIDISKIVSYEFKARKDGSLELKFYDENGKLVKPYAK